MYATSTDAELIRAASFQQNPAIRRLADRLQDRNLIAQRCSKDAADLANMLSMVDHPNGLSDAVRLRAIDQARDLARRLDWTHHVPHYSTED